MNGRGGPEGRPRGPRPVLPHGHLGCEEELMAAVICRRLLGIMLILALPVIAYAQDATLSGTVTDTTGGVLPGVTGTAVNHAAGNTFEGVTDQGGSFPIALRN